MRNPENLSVQQMYKLDGFNIVDCVTNMENRFNEDNPFYFFKNNFLILFPDIKHITRQITEFKKKLDVYPHIVDDSLIKYSQGIINRNVTKLGIEEIILKWIDYNLTKKENKTFYFLLSDTSKYSINKAAFDQKDEEVSAVCINGHGGESSSDSISITPQYT